MKDVKYTLKALVKYEIGNCSLWKAWCKALWRDYVALAVTFSVLSSMVLLFVRKVAVPMFGVAAESLDAAKPFGLLPSTYSVAEYIIMFVLLIFVFASTICCSIRAHKTLRRVVTEYEKKEMSTERRNLLLVENTILTTVSIIVAFLPLFSLFISALQAEINMTTNIASTSVVDTSSIPFWAVKSFCLTVFFGVLFVECVLTFIRLTFRTIVVDQNKTQE